MKKSVLIMTFTLQNAAKAKSFKMNPFFHPTLTAPAILFMWTAIVFPQLPEIRDFVMICVESQEP